MRRPGITDVARAARVSTATVSRVVNGNYSVAAGTKARVLRAIARLGYQPNAVARSLKITRTKVIGFIVSDVSNPHFTAMARAIEDRVSAEGYNLMVCSTDGLRDRELAYLRTLMSRRVDALIINATGFNDPLIAEISRTVPVVLVSRRVRRTVDFRGDFVDSDNRRAAAALTRHLLELGHRRIAVINGPLALSTGRERYAGFVQAMAEQGLAVGRDYPLRYDGDFNEGSGSAGAEALCSLRPGPTALIAMNNAMLLGALKRLRTRGTRVPADVSVAAYGSIPHVELMYTQPSFVTLDPRRLGVEASAMVLSRLADPRLGNRDVVIESELVAGNAVCRIGAPVRCAPAAQRAGQGRRGTSTSRAPVATLRLTTAPTP